MCACVCATVCQCGCQPLRLGRCVATIVLSVKAMPLLCQVSAQRPRRVRVSRQPVYIYMCVCVCVCVPGTWAVEGEGGGGGGGGVTVVSEPTPRRLRLGYWLPVGEPGITQSCQYTVMS